jgi:NACalpha-BTF3-like transcription factor
MNSNLIHKYTSNIQEDIVDLKSTIFLNWKIFSEYITNFLEKEDNNDKAKTEEIKNLLSNCKSLLNENISSAQEIRKLRENISIQSNVLDTLPEKLNNEYNMEKNKYVNLQNVIAQKKTTYEKLSMDLEKLRNRAIFKKAKREIFVTEPNRINVEMNHEIKTTQNILKKLIDMNRRDREAIYYLNLELEELQGKMKNIHNKSAKGKDKESSNNEEEEEEEDEDRKGSS